MKRQTKENKIEQAQSIDLLYRIAKAIASVKDGRELLKIIVEYAQPVFGFYDIGLGVLDKSGEFYLDWASFYTEINHSEANLESKRQENFVIPAAEPLFRYAFERVARENKPFIENLNAEFIERFGDYPQFEVEIAHGFKQFLVTTLRFGGTDIGILNFNSRRENHFETSDFQLFQAIADLVAVAVANITANEEILEREQEKAKLLSISREIAKVQTRRQLLDVIFNTIKSIFPYDDAGLFYFSDPHGTPDPHGNCHVHLLDDLISEVNFELMQKGVTGVIAEGTDVIRFLAAEKAHIISFQQLMQTIPEHPHFPIMEEIGIKQLITIGIKSGGETIGMLCFNSCRENFYSEKDFPLFENITNQVAVALTNILANEEILERTREKSVLLSISEDIASARNAVELMQVIREKAQRLIPFYDTGILIVEDDGKHHYDLAVNLPGWDNSESNLKLQDLGLRRVIHPDSYVEFAMRLIETANSPIIEDWEQRVKEFDHPFFQIIKEFGYKEAIVATLKSGSKTFGTLWLNSLEENHFSPSQFGIFQTLADQIAVAVSNILANEEIERKLAEIKKLKTQLEIDNSYLVEEVKTTYNFEEIIGSATVLRKVFEQIELVAPTAATVLLEGETGTGKELFARAIHNLSPRGKRPLIKVNCACLPSNLVESELFGHERGSFTGATDRRIGKFELANNGTIFLDEIGELPLELQAKLLRVLQEQELERVGGKSPLKLDIRVIAATNRNLREEVAARRFRADLYFRLNTVTLELPPLRERREDVPALAMHFVEKFSNRTGKRIKSVATAALQELMQCDFPGNIRELEHLIEESVIFSKSEKLVLHRPLQFNRLPQTSSSAESNALSHNARRQRTRTYPERPAPNERTNSRRGRCRRNPQHQTDDARSPDETPRHRKTPHLRHTVNNWQEAEITNKNPKYFPVLHQLNYVS